MADEYLTLQSLSRGEYSELRSKFLAFACPVRNVDEVKERVLALRREYHDARHVAYAYSIGVDGEVFRMNDDGEPSGTAGRQILGQIRSKKLRFTLVAVVRYFGGVKLGVSNLSEAYKTAARNALDNASVIRKYVETVLTLRFDYDRMSAVMRAVRNEGGKVVENGYDSKCLLRVSVRNSVLENFKSQLDRNIEIVE